MCRDFIPSPGCKWLYDHWTNFDSWVGKISDKETISLVIDGDVKVRYKIQYIDFVNNTFLTADGELKWIEKEYYKMKRNSITGYILVRERNQCFDS